MVEPRREQVADAYTDAGRSASSPKTEPWQSRACLPQAGREQAAEVVPIPLLWRGARQGGVVERRLPAAGRSGTSRRDKSRTDLFRASFMNMAMKQAPCLFHSHSVKAGRHFAKQLDFTGRHGPCPRRRVHVPRYYPKQESLSTMKKCVVAVAGLRRAASGLSGLFGLQSARPGCFAPRRRSPAWMHAYRDVGGRAASGTAAEAVEPRREQRPSQSPPDFNPQQQRPLPVGIIRAYTAHVHAADRGGSPGECRAFVPTRLYHPALAGTPPGEGNWNHPALVGTPPGEGNWNHFALAGTSRGIVAALPRGAPYIMTSGSRADPERFPYPEGVTR